ncbi:phosphatase PAP2 family protein [Paraburkholderia sp.]|uniref:phosphatase PAP2 family protein n=1 Tax=Paraburkholderia sp. TaxID=1926495 RepID=UPI00239C23F3|nr:phosphatase PAP2 family protein [Paraburkholderia sp.]MDE1180431.1 phosphatase PAP2 family protein [Paraburkholderia sp.]
MWSALSNLGDAALTMPLAVTCAVWLAMSLLGWRSATSWLMLLAAGALMVGVTKILYAGCGVQIRAIDFRVISGHTMLASAVWPMALMLCLPANANRQPRVALAMGLALAAVIGTARVFDDAHTVSEVIAGWGVGSLVTLFYVRWKNAPVLPAKLRPLAVASLLTVSTLAYGHHAPIQAAIEMYSPFLCGRGV